MSRLRDALARGEFVVTGEVAPPHGTDCSAMIASAEKLAPVVHAVNVTDNQAAMLHMSSFAASRALLDSGCECEPVLQLTCRDRNRLALQSDLLGAWALGLESVLLLSGDDPRGGDHPKAKGVFDLDSTLLMEVVKGLNAGVDMVGAPLTGATDFLIGGALFPEVEPWEIQLDRALQKVDAGATFFQTQGITDLDKFARAAEAIRPSGAKIIAGIVLFKNPGVIKFINERLAGMMIPESISERIIAAADPLEEAITVAAEQVSALRGLADGVHIMPLGADDAVPRILERAGIA